MGRPGIKVEVSASEREQLVSMSRSRSLPHSLVRRARIVLMAADGHLNNPQHDAKLCIAPHSRCSTFAIQRLLFGRLRAIADCGNSRPTSCLDGLLSNDRALGSVDVRRGGVRWRFVGCRLSLACPSRHAADRFRCPTHPLKSARISRTLGFVREYPVGGIPTAEHFRGAASFLLARIRSRAVSCQIAVQSHQRRGLWNRARPTLPAVNLQRPHSIGGIGPWSNTSVSADRIVFQLKECHRSCVLRRRQVHEMI
jgi:hypothetical protein